MAEPDHCTIEKHDPRARACAERARIGAAVEVEPFLSDRGVKVLDYFLDKDDIWGIANYLAVRGWLEPGERVEGAEQAGQGNMNCTVRVRTSLRTVILKQSRPYVERYPHIAAPIERAATEAAFYRQACGNAALSGRMPQLLAWHQASNLLMLEDLEKARDFTFLYGQRSAPDPGDFEALAHFLQALHGGFRDRALAGLFTNPSMRMLNHEHVFDLPLRQENGLNLDAMTVGLQSVSAQLKSEPAYAARVAALGGLYLDNHKGSCLIHGDFFPGSWLKAGNRVYVIDPEFAFFGPPEWDWGVMIAHLHLAGAAEDFVRSLENRCAAAAWVDLALARQFAGVEIMRRLIGVAQLPLECGLERKQRLLDLSRNLVLQGSTI